MMKQVVQRIGKKKIELLEVPQPGPQMDRVIVRAAFSLISSGTERASREFSEASVVKKVRKNPVLAKRVVQRLLSNGISHTLNQVRTRLSKPEGLGYSLSGTVLDVAGNQWPQFQEGDRVACAGAGYAVHAEVVSVPRNLVARVPRGVDLAEAAFASVGAIALHGVRQADVRLGESVAVIGLGLVGQLCVGLCRAAGCDVIGIDLVPGRFETALTVGASVAFLPDDAASGIEELTGGRGVDAVLICAATETNEPMILAGQLARSKGKVVVVGDVRMDAPRNLYYSKELDLRISRSMGPGRYDPLYEEKGLDYPYEYVRWTENRNMQSFLNMLESSRLDVTRLITHRFPITKAEEAYELLTGEDAKPSLGILLEYPEGSKPNLEGRTIRIPKGPQAKSRKRQGVSEDIGIGFLGTGGFARGVLLPILQKKARVKPVVLVSGTGLAARELADQYRFSFASTDVSEVWTNPDIQAVFIANRHNLHARQVIQALRSGKHVFVEKPLCISYKELCEIEEVRSSLLISHSPPILMVGYNRRFAPLVKDLRVFFAGRQEPAYISYRVIAGWIPGTHWIQDPQIGGGRIIGEACHFLDLILFLLQESGSVEFDALGLPNGGRYCNDNVSISLRTPDGSIGTLSYLATGDPAGGKELIEMHCGGKTAILRDFLTLELYSGGTKKMLSYKGSDVKGHSAEVSAFLDALKQGSDAPIPFAEISLVSQLTFNIHESLGVSCSKFAVDVATKNDQTL